MNDDKAKGAHTLPFYVLLHLLRKEADLLPLQKRLVGDVSAQKLTKGNYLRSQLYISRILMEYRYIKCTFY